MTLGTSVHSLPSLKCQCWGLERWLNGEEHWPPFQGAQDGFLARVLFLPVSPTVHGMEWKLSFLTNKRYGLLHCQGWVLPLLPNPPAMFVDVLQPSIFLHPWILSPLRQESQHHLLSHMCSWQMCFQRGGQGIQWSPERTAPYCYGSPGKSFCPRALLSAQRASIPSAQVRAAHWRGGLYVGSWQGENLNYRTNTYRAYKGEDILQSLEHRVAMTWAQS